MSHVEVVTFKLAAGKSAQQLLNTEAAMQAFLTEQPGFLYRSLSCHEQGADSEQWFDIIYWEDAQQAQAGGEALMASPLGAELMSAIDPATCVVRHMPTLCEHMSCELAEQA